jgi:hypothetical protein
MDDGDTLWEQSRDQPPFSNSDGYAWFEANCTTCIWEKPARQGDEGNGCPLVLLALVGRTPAQWIAGNPDDISSKYTCIEYRHEDDGPDPEPKPIPTPPGQGELLPRQPYEGVRMLNTIAHPVLR